MKPLLQNVSPNNILTMQLNKYLIDLKTRLAAGEKHNRAIKRQSSLFIIAFPRSIVSTMSFTLSANDSLETE